MEPRKKHVLIAMDGTDQSLDIVRYVARLLPAGQVAITLFHVMDLIPESTSGMEFDNEPGYRVTGFRDWQFHQESAMGRIMMDAMQSLVSMGHKEDDLSIIMADRNADIVRDIVQEGKKGYVALVIGRSGIDLGKDPVLGSRSGRLVDLVGRLPVWVVGGRPDPSKILIAMDNSEGARRALDYVGDIFKDKHPELLLFHVAKKSSVMQPEYAELVSVHHGRNWSERSRNEFNTSEEAMEAYLQKCIAELEQKGSDRNRIGMKVVHEADSRSEAMMEEAVKGGYGTIVVGTRDLSKMERFIRERVSTKMLRLSEGVAVWVVH